MSVSLTDNAAKYIEKQLADRGHGSGIRIGIKPSGCSGFSYVLEYVDTPAEHDYKFTSEGVSIFIDPKSLAILDGTELDFVRKGINQGFVFNNPNEKARCGCGESFTL